MWWSYGDKKKEDDMARTEMELALSLARTNPDVFDPWEKYYKLQFESHKARIESDVLQMQKSMLTSAVKAAERYGMINHDEYAKYLLDETGAYIPKIRQIEKKDVLKYNKPPNTMRIFKLIKKYPGSPKIGTIVTELMDGEKETIYMFPNRICGLTSQAIEGFPEFWQEQEKNSVKKAPEEDRKFLFKTEDGVNKYEGDICYSIHRDSPLKIDYMSWTKDRTGDGYIYFDEKEEAKNHKKNNFKCLSIVDVMITARDRKNLSALVEERIENLK